MTTTNVLTAPQRVDARASGWYAQYHQRTTTAEDAVRQIHSGQRVFMSGMCSVPQTLLRALVAHAPNLHDVEIVQVLTIVDSAYVAPGMERHLRVNTLFISPNVRTAVNQGRADFTPIFLSEIPDLCRNHLDIDVALIQVSPPDEDGFCSFGIEVGISKPAALAAKKIIAEVNAQMPRTLGDSFIHVSRLDQIVEVDYTPPELPMGSGEPIELAIGRHIAGLIDDGATLQMGIGGIPDGVLHTLRTAGIRELGIHT